jgi:hypothetical protein
MSADPYSFEPLTAVSDRYYKPKRKLRNLSHRRWAEFRGRYLRKMFGDAKTRAVRKERLMRIYGGEHKFLGLSQ